MFGKSFSQIATLFSLVVLVSCSQKIDNKPETKSPNDKSVSKKTVITKAPVDSEYLSTSTDTIVLAEAKPVSNSETDSTIVLHFLTLNGYDKEQLETTTLHQWEGITFEDNEVVSIVLDNPNIDTIPPGICSLTNLKTLKLKTDSSLVFPKEIHNLSELCTLQVMNCIHRSASYTILPDDIGGLKSLTFFWVQGLATLPPSIGQLEGLKVLRLSGSNVATLPDEILNLSLDFIDFRGNPIADEAVSAKMLSYMDSSDGRWRVARVGIADDIVWLERDWETNSSNIDTVIWLGPNTAVKVQAKVTFDPYNHGTFKLSSISVRDTLDSTELFRICGDTISWDSTGVYSQFDEKEIISTSHNFTYGNFPLGSLGGSLLQFIDIDNDGFKDLVIEDPKQLWTKGATYSSTFHIYLYDAVKQTFTSLDDFPKMYRPLLFKEYIRGFRKYVKEKNSFVDTIYYHFDFSRHIIGPNTEELRAEVEIGNDHTGLVVVELTNEIYSKGEFYLRSLSITDKKSNTLFQKKIPPKFGEPFFAASQATRIEITSQHSTEEYRLGMYLMQFIDVNSDGFLDLVICNPNSSAGSADQSLRLIELYLFNVQSGKYNLMKESIELYNPVVTKEGLHGYKAFNTEDSTFSDSVIHSWHSRS